MAILLGPAADRIETTLLERIPQLDAIVEALAYGLHSTEWIAAVYGVEPKLIDRLLADRRVQAMIEAVQRRLLDGSKPVDRARAKAGMALEAALPVLVELAHDADVPVQQRLATIAELGRIAGVRSVRPTAEPAAHERVSVHIHLGDASTITIEGEAVSGDEGSEDGEGEDGEGEDGEGEDGEGEDGGLEGSQEDGDGAGGVDEEDER